MSLALNHHSSTEELSPDDTVGPARSHPATGGVLNAVGRGSPRLAGRLAFELWRRPLVRAAVRPEERAVHQAARVDTIVHGARSVTTYSWGGGERPVLLVHGWRARASRFAHLVTELLDAGYSPVSYDAPAHGGTGGPAGTILDHEAIMATLAARHGPFEAVVAHSLAVPFALYAVGQGLPTDRVVAVSGVGRFAYLADAFSAGLGLRPAVAAELKRSIERRLFDGDRDIWRRFSADVPGGCDVLVIHDRDDRIVDLAQAGVITKAYGERATYVETNGLGHSRILHSTAVVDAVLEFIGRGRDADG